MVGLPGFEPESMYPLEYVLPGVVKDMRQAIAEGDLDCFERLCSLLESLGGRE